MIYVNVQEKIKNIVKALVIFGLYLSLSYLLSYAFKEAFASKNAFINSTSLILANLFILLIIIAFYVPKLVKDSKSLTKADLKIAYKNWLIGLAIMYFSNIIILLINKDLATNEAFNRALIEKMPIYAILVMVIIAPITEELIFRLSLKDIVKNKYLYCLISGLIFGLMHLTTAKSLTEILFVIPYGALGFFFAKSLFETDNIYAPIMTHITHNALIIFFLISSNLIGI